MATVAGRLWEGWKQIAKRIGDFQARVLLVIFYFAVFCPFALVVRWVGDPLAIKPATARGWRSKVATEGAEIERARRQF